jgi:hypothetical protein
MLLDTFRPAVLLTLIPTPALPTQHLLSANKTEIPILIITLDYKTCTAEQFPSIELYSALGWHKYGPKHVAALLPLI